MQRLLGLTFVFIAALFAISRFLVAQVPNVAAPEKAQAYAASSRAEPAGGGFAEEGTVIERDGSGQFHLTAQVDGENAEFLIDTGADIVALTEDEARRLHIEVSPDDFIPIMETASGTGHAAPVRLRSFRLGDEDFGGIDAVVVRGLGVNLLGQSVLRRLGKVELQGDRMVIAHR
jgi:aspartyl protease family protein